MAVNPDSALSFLWILFFATVEWNGLKDSE